MSKQELTPWFPADMKPVRVGMYEREYNFWTGLDARDYWNGEKWIVCLNGFWDGSDYSATSLKKWRGLASDPNA